MPKIHDASARASTDAVSRWRRVPPNLFGIAFGLAGLAEAWHAARPTLGTPSAVSDAIMILAACVWLALAVAYVAQGSRQIIDDLRHPVLAPFVPIAPITAMILAAALAPYAFDTARVLVIVFLAMTIAVGGWMTGQWIVGDLARDTAHPGYFLPTIAGGLVGGYAASQVGLHGLAEASFGIGVVCWLLLGSTILNRLFFRPGLPAALVPTLAIELAPPTVGGVAYFALTGGATDFVASALAGYAVLMVIVQLRFLPLYLKLSFAPGFWAFTFSYAAAATDALLWIHLKRPPDATVYAVVVITVITGFISTIAVRTVILTARGRLLPSPPAGDPAPIR